MLEVCVDEAGIPPVRRLDPRPPGGGDPQVVLVLDTDDQLAPSSAALLDRTPGAVRAANGSTRTKIKYRGKSASAAARQRRHGSAGRDLSDRGAERVRHVNVPRAVHRYTDGAMEARRASSAIHVARSSRHAGKVGEGVLGLTDSEHHRGEQH